MTAVPEKRTVLPPTDRGFRLAIVVSTTLIFAAVFGWLACIQRTEVGDVEFHWQSSALLWIATGLGCTIYFWRQIWPTQNAAATNTTRRQIKGWAALMIPSLMWLAYPLRFISGQQLLNVFIGLAIAATVLTLGGWMVFQLIKGFTAGEAPAAKTVSHAPGDSTNAPAGEDSSKSPSA